MAHFLLFLSLLPFRSWFKTFYIWCTEWGSSFGSG